MKKLGMLIAANIVFLPVEFPALAAVTVLFSAAAAMAWPIIEIVEG